MKTAKVNSKARKAIAAAATATDRENAARMTAARATIAAHKADKAAARAARKYAADPTPGNADKAARKARKADRAAAALTAANADRAAAENAATAARNAAAHAMTPDERKATADRATADRRKAATDYAADLAGAWDRVRAARDKWTLTGDADRDPLTLQAMATAAVDSKLKFRANTWGKGETVERTRKKPACAACGGCTGETETERMTRYKQGGEVEQLQPADRDDLAGGAVLAMWELYAAGERDTATLYRAALASMDKFFRAARRKAATPEYDPNFSKCNPDPRPMTPTPTNAAADRATRAAAERAAAVLDDLCAAVLDDLCAGMTPGNIKAVHGLTENQYRRVRKTIFHAMLPALTAPAAAVTNTAADLAAAAADVAAADGDPDTDPHAAAVFTALAAAAADDHAAAVSAYPFAGVISPAAVLDKAAALTARRTDGHKADRERDPARKAQNAARAAAYRARKKAAAAADK